MDADGGKAKYPGNKAGVSYGTGYCDASCPRYMKFVGGQVSEVVLLVLVLVVMEGRFDQGKLRVFEYLVSSEDID